MPITSLTESVIFTQNLKKSHTSNLGKQEYVHCRQYLEKVIFTLWCSWKNIAIYFKAQLTSITPGTESRFIGVNSSAYKHVTSNWFKVIMSIRRQVGRNDRIF